MEARFRWTVAFLATLFLGGGWILASKEPTSGAVSLDGLTEGALAGYLAPDFSLPAIDGSEMSLSELRGQPALLNFWATWCPPCRQEMPHLQAVSETFAGKAHVIGVDQGETADQVAAFADEIGIDFPLLIDEDGRVNKQFGVVALPTTIFIDENGVVTELFAGVLNEAVATDKLNQMLADGGSP